MKGDQKKRKLILFFKKAFTVENFLGVLIKKIKKKRGAIKEK